jgi:hypothetical protein
MLISQQTSFNEYTSNNHINNNANNNQLAKSSDKQQRLNVNMLLTEQHHEKKKQQMLNLSQRIHDSQLSQTTDHFIHSTNLTQSLVTGGGSAAGRYGLAHTINNSNEPPMPA